MGLSSPGGQWEPIHEASFRCGIRVDSLVDPAWENCFRHGELPEVGDFLGFGFEILQAGMGQNKVQNQQPGLDQFTRKAATIAQVIAVESAVDLARKEVKDRRPVSTSGGPNVAEPDTLAGELVNVPALRGARVIKKLVHGEIAGVRGDEVEKTGFLLVVAEINESREMCRTGHSDRMSNIISGSDMAGRSRAASSGSAYIANPVWALAAKACA